jgi:hypothetical protein
MHTVHVRVNDAATKQPTPVRIHFRDADGNYFAPFGRLTDFATDLGVDVGGNVDFSGRKYAFIDGACEIGIPSGPMSVEVRKGFEYRPLCQTMHVGAAKLALRLGVERWIDMRGLGWYSGDTWAQDLTPHAALLEAAAEDLAVVNLLAAETLVSGYGGRQYPAISNILAFSGQQPALRRDGHLVVVNTLNQHETLGRLALLNCHRAVYPLSFGGRDGVDDWSLADWCDQCHRKAGLVIGHNFFDHYGGYHHGELLADLILGKIDALELNGGFEHHDNPVLGEWQALLDAGFRVPVVGGSDKRDNLGILGSRRTYARLEPGQEFNYKNWIEAVRAGRTFVTNGPLLFFTVEGLYPGAVVHLPPGGGTVRVRAEAKCLAAFERVEVVANGMVRAHADARGSPAEAVVEAEVPMTGSGWLAARCVGPYDGEGTMWWLGAQTSPVYVAVEGAAPKADVATLAPFFKALDEMRDWVAHSAKCATDKHREHLASIFESARTELTRRQR